jgi:hypothetical protein
MTVTIKTGHTKPKPKTGPETFEEIRLEGFRAARDGVYHPEAYAKGHARRAYQLGRDQWVELMAQER